MVNNILHAFGNGNGFALAHEFPERTRLGTLWFKCPRSVEDRIGAGSAVLKGNECVRAYFTEGQDISNQQVLTEVVTEAGLDRGKVEGVLNGGDGLEAIKEAEKQARQIRVEGVPFFIINGKITMSGAQPSGAFLAAFREAVGVKLRI